MLPISPSLPRVSQIEERVEQFCVQLPPLVLPDNHPGSRSMASWIDHTLLKPDATPAQITRLCEEARAYDFFSVCINPLYVGLAHQELAGSPVQVCTVVGFPLGASPTRVKVYETRACLEKGAREIDMVIPVGLLRAGEYDAVLEDIQAVTETAHAMNALVKVILEMALLNEKEKIAGCLISQAAGAEFVKTSTGFGPGGATLGDVELMRRVVGPHIGVKAAGGVRSLADARAMLAAGATRLGSSAGVIIMQQLEAGERE
jgi:deoxyribose-phosphate aldolase